jgi:MerR family mercuric resistance operon transcriptional regulator
MDGLRIGELAKQSRVHLQTIRYYEREGLLPKPRRSPSGYRIFSSEDVRRVRFIKQAQGLGFSLNEIRELLALRVHPGTTCAEVRKRTTARIADIDEKQQALAAMKNALVRLTAACSGEGAISDCPILESLDSEKEVLS